MLKKIWHKILKQVENGNAFSAAFSIFLFLIIIALCSSYFISSKPLYVQFYYALFGIGLGGIIGVVAGLVIGGIGIALGGIAFGIAGWLAGAIFGAGIGGAFGLLASFFTNPSAYSFHVMRFFIVAVVALLIAAFVFLLMKKLFLYTKHVVSRAWAKVKIKLNPLLDVASRVWAKVKIKLNPLLDWVKSKFCTKKPKRE